MTYVPEILRRARAIISDEKHWTQGSYARDENGNDVLAGEGFCFCAVGAIHKAGGFDICRSLPLDFVEPFLEDEALAGYGQCLLEGKIVEFNDTHTQSDVLALFDRAIARAERVSA